MAPCACVLRSLPYHQMSLCVGRLSRPQYDKKLLEPARTPILKVLRHWEKGVSYVELHTNHLAVVKFFCGRWAGNLLDHHLKGHVCTMYMYTLTIIVLVHLFIADLLWVFNYHTLFGSVVRWYSWISEQVMVKENNTRSFSSVVSGWTEVTKKSHSRACHAQRRRLFLHGRSLTKFRQDYFSRFGWCSRKPRI